MILLGIALAIAIGISLALGIGIGIGAIIGYIGVGNWYTGIAIGSALAI